MSTSNSNMDLNDTDNSNIGTTTPQHLSPYLNTFLSFRISHTDPLKSNVILNHPFVKVSLIDEDTNQYIMKSDMIRVAPHNSNTDTMTNYILPQMTKCTYKISNCITPYWDDELIFNEDLVYLLSNKKLVIFFEILDFKKSVSIKKHKLTSKCCDIAWAFLKLCKNNDNNDNNNNNSNNTNINNLLNTEDPLRLQLFTRFKKYSKFQSTGSTMLYSTLLLQLKHKYPSTLYVFVKSLDLSSNTPTFSSTALDHLEIGSILQLRNGSLTDTNVIPSVGWRKITIQKRNANFVSNNYDVIGISSLQYASNGKMLAVASYGNKKYILVVYDTITLHEFARYNNHSGIIYDLHWCRYSSKLASASQDSTVRVYKIISDKDKYHLSCTNVLLHPHYVYCCSFHPLSDNLLVSAGYDRIIRVWDTSTMEMYNSNIILELTGHTGYINTINFDIDGVKLYSGDSTGVVMVWQTPMEASSTRYPTDAWQCIDYISIRELIDIPIMHIVAHGDGRRIFIQCSQNVIRLLDTRRKIVLKRYAGTVCKYINPNLCVTPCGNYLFQNTREAKILVWQVESGNLLTTYTKLQFQISIESFYIPCMHYTPLHSCIAIGTYGLGNSLFHVMQHTPYDTQQLITQTVTRTHSKQVTINRTSQFHLTSALYNEGMHNETYRENISLEFLKAKVRLKLNYNSAPELFDEKFSTQKSRQLDLQISEFQTELHSKSLLSSQDSQDSNFSQSINILTHRLKLTDSDIDNNNNNNNNNKNNNNNNNNDNNNNNNNNI